MDKSKQAICQLQSLIQWNAFTRLGCCILIFTFCFIFISIQRSFKSFGEKFWYFLSKKLSTKLRQGLIILIVKIILLELALALSLLFRSTDKAQCFIHLGFSLNLQFVDGVSSDLQKLHRYFNSAAIVAFYIILLPIFEACWATLFSINLALYLKDSKASVLQYHY